MALFSNFDSGKGLKKQSEGFAKQSGTQQNKRRPGLVKQYEAFANRYLYSVLTDSAKINPAEMRHGAESLVDIAVALESPHAAYRTMAELAGRSRKVPVVPQLAQLVDRLLELPTDQNKERAALLSWRIVTGTLSSERYLSYLKERAHLTDDSRDWRDYAMGVGKFIRDGVVQANDDIINETLQDLVTNKLSLGDQVASIQQMLAESMMSRRNYRQAEFLLTEVAISGKDAPDGFAVVVESLLNVRPECCWELHQLVLEHALQAYGEGEDDWASLLQKLARTKLHQDSLLAYLLDHPMLTTSERLAAFTLQNIGDLEPGLQASLRERWEQAFNKAGLRPPSSLTLPAEDVVVQQAPPSLGGTEEPTGSAQALIAAAHESLSDTSELETLLSDHMPLDELDTGSIRAALKQLSRGSLPEWAPFEARLWFVRKLLARGKQRSALQLLDDLVLRAGARDVGLLRERYADQALDKLFTRLTGAHGDRGPTGELRLRYIQLALQRDDFKLGFGHLEQIEADSSARSQAFHEFEDWVRKQANPTPLMLMMLARSRRLTSDDPVAGFDTATTAALLAPDDPEIAAAYRIWTDALPAMEVHRCRASQAVYLVVREERRELFQLAIDEITAVADHPEVDAAELSGWLEQLQPVLLQLPVTVQHTARLEWTTAYLKLAAGPAGMDRAESRIAESLEGLTDEEQQAVLTGVSNRMPQAASMLTKLTSQLAESGQQERRRRVEAEMQQARANGRPLRYSAGDTAPPADTGLRPGSDRQAGRPWRRNLAIARSRRTEGDLVGAIRTLQGVRELGLKMPEIDLELAECFAAASDYALARRVYGEVLEELARSQADVELRLRGLYGLATVIEHLNSPAEAAHVLEQLLTIRHDYRDTHERLDRLRGELAKPPNGDQPSNVAANAILDEILSLLSDSGTEQVESGGEGA